MGAEMDRQNDAFQKDYDKIYAKGTWTKEDIETMKDLKKLIYYNKVICAMDEGGEYPGSEHMPDARMSYAQGRDAMGRYTSGTMGRSDGSGMHYPQYMYDNGRNYWDDSWASGRRYYDSEKEKAIHKLHHMMENTDDPERKNALKIAINELEQK